MSFLEPLMSFVNAVFVKKDDTRPIGLKQFHDYSTDDLLNQLSRPIGAVAPLQPTLSKKAIAKTAPAFAHTPPAQYNYQSFQHLKQYPQFPRR